MNAAPQESASFFPSSGLITLGNKNLMETSLNKHRKLLSIEHKHQDKYETRFVKDKAASMLDTC